MSDQKIFKIYDYMNNVEPKDFTLPPFDQDYNVLGLYKNRKFNKGELYEVEYYGEYDPMNQSNPYNNKVVCEHRIYYRYNEMINRREMRICWILEDGSTGATKTTIKYYTPEESIVAGERRRAKAIATLKTNTVGLIMAVNQVSQQNAETEGKPFLAAYADEITQYISGYEEPLKNVILTSSSFDWLDKPIDINGTLVRHYMYDGINIDYTINNTYL